MESNQVVDALLGVAIGDAVGVPLEFSSRAQMIANPAKDMIGYGTYNQAPGTWSDDSSLTFCLAEALTSGYNLQNISNNFIKWREEAYWSARGKVFDIGHTTHKAISRLNEILTTDNLEQLSELKEDGEEFAFENGNGSLMRIMPLLFYIKGKPIAEQFNIIWEVSALTHRHIRAGMSCLIYLRLAEKLMEGKQKEVAYQEMRADILSFWEVIEFPDSERAHFSRVVQNDIRTTTIEALKSGGYVIEVLESSIWFFLQKESFEDTILSIINIGHDTDTSAAIAGGLAGIYYGQKSIPEYWLISLARLEDILDLGNSLHQKYCT